MILQRYAERDSLRFAGSVGATGMMGRQQDDQTKLYYEFSRRPNSTGLLPQRTHCYVRWRCIALSSGQKPGRRLRASGRRRLRRANPAANNRDLIAVLPFVNMSSDRENEFLSDGISEDLLNALSWIEGLHVAKLAQCRKAHREQFRRIAEPAIWSKCR